jgi:hypothetical protein
VLFLHVEGGRMARMKSRVRYFRWHQPGLPLRT